MSGLFKKCFVLSVLVFSVFAWAGDKQPTEIQQTGTVASANTPAQPSAHAAKIVFVGKKQACDCTRKRIDSSIFSLRAALKDGPKIPVERIEVDVDTQQAAQLQKMKPLSVIPGVYVLDKKGSLVTLLQGEITADQITAAIR